MLKNLTTDISSDTIYFLSILLFLSNLLFHDYGKNPTTHTIFPDSLSINAAVSASVLLASRLESNVEVCILMFASVILFALFPVFRRSARNYFNYSGSDFVMTFILFTVTLYMWCIHHPDQEQNYGNNIAILHVTSAVFVTFVCPFILVKVQRYKQ